MPAARYSTGLSKIKKGLFSTGLAKVKAGYMYESGEYTKVWSFGSKVSYYDGDTLLGVEEIDEGQDVLHPSISMGKENYTFYGWTMESGSLTREETLVATGEDITLYAIYVPNTLEVGKVSISSWSGSTSTQWYVNWNVQKWNSDFVSGDNHLLVPNAFWGTSEANGSFVLNKRMYQNAQITLTMETRGGTGSGGNGYLDGNMVVYINPTSSYTGVIAEGTHTIKSSAYASEYHTGSAFYISSLVLSNPIAWE